MSEFQSAHVPATIEVVAQFDDAPMWDRYVESHPEGRFSQLFAYRCIERAYGYRPHYFGIQSQGRLVGVLPVFEARSALLGRRLVSQPFSEYGGLLLNADLGDSARALVLASMRNFLGAQGFAELETHGNYGCGSERLGFSRDNAQQLATLALAGDNDAVWNKSISRHVRKAVRKAEREGLSTCEKSDVTALREWFFPLYLRSMKRLGAPPHSLDFFLHSRAAFGEKMRVFWALHDGAPIAGLLGFRCGRRVSIVNIVSDERAWHMRPNDLVHWEFIKWAVERGCLHFDFGSVRYQGQSQFKEKWGCDMQDSGYYFLAADAASVHRSFDSSSRTMALAGRVWQRFVPPTLARIMGPLLRRHLVR